MAVAAADNKPDGKKPHASTSNGLPAMLCPHCDSRSLIRDSSDVTETFRNVYYRCNNLECGHTWKAALQFVHTISPSAMPRRGLNLPIAPAPEPKPKTRFVDDGTQPRLEM